jgi:hypothetical protein
MTTDRQAESNRLNAQKSTGATSQAGREASSRNSLRHGLLAQALTLEGESPDAFQTYLESLYQLFQPANVHETALIDTMAVSHWRKMRAIALEGATVNHKIRDQYLDMDLDKDGPLDSITRASLAVKSLTKESNILQLLNRYETSFARQYAKAYSMLQQSQKQNNHSDFDNQNPF